MLDQIDALMLNCDAMDNVYETKKDIPSTID